MTIDFFKDLAAAASDPSYPATHSKARPEHYEHFRSLIDKFFEAAPVVLAAMSVEDQYRSFSFSASQTRISQIVSAIEDVEAEVEEQKRRFDEGDSVTLVDARHRHTLNSALNHLYFEMGDYFKAIKTGAIEVVDGVSRVPNSEEVVDVRDRGNVAAVRYLTR